MLNELLNYGGLGILFLSALGVLFEIAPIKLNPIGWLGRRFNAHLSEEIADVKADVAEVGRLADERDALNSRYRIIRFADELMHSPEILHSEEHFNQIEECITAYGRYCDKHPEFANHKAKASIKRINEVYEKCRKLNNFLK